MPEFHNLQDLEEYLRKTLPDAKSIQKLRRNDDAKFVDFHWHQRHFAVQSTLAVFEIKEGRHLFVTGASRLVQASLQIKDRNLKVIGAVVETLEQAEDVVRKNRDQGLALVASCKATLGRLLAK